MALCILALAEIGLRCAGVEPLAGGAGIPPWMDEETHDLWRRWTERQGVRLADVTDLSGWRWDPELRWALEPDLALQARNIFLDPSLGDAATWRLTTNDRGFRTPRHDRVEPPDRVRVVVLGDSNSMGWCLNDEATYPRRLETKLGDRLGREVEVINLGVGGYTSFSARILLEREALPLSPDALVLAVGANDPQRMTTDDARYARRFSGFAGRLRRDLGRLRLVALVRGWLGGAPVDRVPRVSPEAWSDNLTALLARARERGLPVVFLRVCCCTEEYERRLQEAAARYAMPVLDARAACERTLADPGMQQRHARRLAEIAHWYGEAERRADPSLRYLFRDGCHLNPLGAELVAGALAERLAGMVGQE